MPQLQALIFDVDGTLAETERDGHRLAFNQAFAAAGLAWQWSIDLYGELLEVAGGKERIQFYLDRHLPDFVPPSHWTQTLKEHIAELHRSKTSYYKQLLAQGEIPARLGVLRLLQEARTRRIRLAIATTSSPENATSLLKAALSPEAIDWFEVIAAGDIVPAKKPAPDIYLYTLEAMGLEPQNCLVIEDSYQGLRAAHAAGLKTVITCNDYTRHQDFGDAVLVLNHLGEPDQPFEVIAGDPGSATYFDLALAEQILGL